MSTETTNPTTETHTTDETDTTTPTTSTTSTTQTDTLEATGPCYLGQVKWFSGGMGFITDFDTQKDVFVHHKGIKINVECWRSLERGEYVYYQLGKTEEGRDQAVNVTGVRGGPLKCEVHALDRAEREKYNQSRERTSDRRQPGRGGHSRRTDTRGSDTRGSGRSYNSGGSRRFNNGRSRPSRYNTSTDSTDVSTSSSTSRQ